MDALLQELAFMGGVPDDQFSHRRRGGDGALDEVDEGFVDVEMDCGEQSQHAAVEATRGRNEEAKKTAQQQSKQATGDSLLQGSFLENLGLGLQGIFWGSTQDDEDDDDSFSSDDPNASNGLFLDLFKSKGKKSETSPSKGAGTGKNVLVRSLAQGGWNQSGTSELDTNSNIASYNLSGAQDDDEQGRKTSSNSSRRRRRRVIGNNNDVAVKSLAHGGWNQSGVQGDHDGLSNPRRHSIVPLPARKARYASNGKENTTPNTTCSAGDKGKNDTSSPKVLGNLVCAMDDTLYSNLSSSFQHSSSESSPTPQLAISMDGSVKSCDETCEEPIYPHPSSDPAETKRSPSAPRLAISMDGSAKSCDETWETVYPSSNPRETGGPPAPRLTISMDGSVRSCEQTFWESMYSQPSSSADHQELKDSSTTSFTGKHRPRETEDMDEVDICVDNHHRDHGTGIQNYHDPPSDQAPTLVVDGYSDDSDDFSFQPHYVSSELSSATRFAISMDGSVKPCCEETWEPMYPRSSSLSDRRDFKDDAMSFTGSSLMCPSETEFVDEDDDILKEEKRYGPFQRVQRLRCISLTLILGFVLTIIVIAVVLLTGGGESEEQVVVKGVSSPTPAPLVAEMVAYVQTMEPNSLLALENEKVMEEVVHVKDCP